MKPPLAYRPFPPFADWAEIPVDLGYWRQALEELEGFRRQATPAQVEKAARYVARATAVDTAAIEGLYRVDRGFTLSVAAQAGGWEGAFEEKGDEARHHFEAQLRAFELVLDAATRQLPVIEALVRALHEHVCASQATYRVWTGQGWQDHALERGAYKRVPNNPHGADGPKHLYAPPDRVAEEMERLVAELGGEAFRLAPAPVQAAYAHHAFVSIHPFADGNGRVARALASIYLVRATSVPFLLFADQKPAYLDALEAADRGRYVDLIETVRDRSIGAMNFMALQLQKALAPRAGEVRDASWGLSGSPDATEVEMDRRAQRLLGEAARAIRKAFDRLDLPQPVAVEVVAEGPVALPPTQGYRSLNSAPAALSVRLGTPSLGQEVSTAYLHGRIARDPDHPNRIRIEEVYRRMRFDASPRELYPDLAQALLLRLDLWAETLATVLVDEALHALR